MKLYVIGKPIKHSLSPIIHNFWINRYSLKTKYEKKEINRNQLSQIIKKIRLKEIKGINVTLPYKREILSLIDEMSDSAKDCKAINTVFLRKSKIYGDNTDGKGFVKSCEIGLNFNFQGTKIFLVGAGGSSYGIVSELIKKNVKEILISNRTEENVQKLTNHFQNTRTSLLPVKWPNLKPPSDVSMVINTTSFGMKKGEHLKINVENLKNQTVFADIIYKPKETEMLKEVKLNGFKTINGLDMLIYQAAISFELWFDISLTRKDIKDAKEICEKSY